jgi:hypothetical protein
MSCHHRSAWYNAAKDTCVVHMSCHHRSAWHGIRIWITDLRRSRHQQVFRPSPNLLRAHHSARRPWPDIRMGMATRSPCISSIPLLVSSVSVSSPTTTACKKKPLVCTCIGIASSSILSSRASSCLIGLNRLISPRPTGQHRCHAGCSGT